MVCILTWLLQRLRVVCKLLKFILEVLWSSLLARCIWVCLLIQLPFVLRGANNVAIVLLRVKNYIIFTNYRWASVLARVLAVLSVFSFVLRILLKHVVDFIHVLLVHLSVIA